jgi:hypothetical protein
VGAGVIFKTRSIISKVPALFPLWLGLLAISGLGRAATPEPTPACGISPIVLAHYSFNGNDNDSSGNGYNLSVTKDIYPVFVQDNCGGTGTQQVSDPNGGLYESSAFAAAISNQSAYTVQGYFNTGSGNGTYLMFAMRESDGQRQLYYNQGKHSLNWQDPCGSEAFAVLSPNTCHEVAASVNNGMICFYVDGSAVGTYAACAATTSVEGAVFAFEMGGGMALDDWTVSLGFPLACACSIAGPSATPTPASTPTALADVSPLAVPRGDAVSPVQGSLEFQFNTSSVGIGSGPGYYAFGIAGGGAGYRWLEGYVYAGDFYVWSQSFGNILSTPVVADQNYYVGVNWSPSGETLSIGTTEASVVQVAAHQTALPNATLDEVDIGNRNVNPQEGGAPWSAGYIGQFRLSSAPRSSFPTTGCDSATLHFWSLDSTLSDSCGGPPLATVGTAVPFVSSPGPLAPNKTWAGTFSDTSYRSYLAPTRTPRHLRRRPPGRRRSARHTAP